MSSIFISHSSVDSAAANSFKAWLQAQGHMSLFLDFDIEAGMGDEPYRRTCPDPPDR
jgi:hypothetical protein